MRPAPAALAAIALHVAPATAEPHAIFGSADIAAVRSDAAVRRIVARADAALARPPRAIPRLHTEGTLPGKGIRTISLHAKEDQPAVLNLALAWRLTRERRYLDQAGRYLADWATVYRPSFNPIDETGFDTMLMATDLTRRDLPPAVRAGLDAFWRRMAAGYLDAMDGTPRNAITNWQSHRVKLATMAAFATGDRTLVRRARDAFRRQVAANIRRDGSVHDFHERDALHYVTYDLDPLLMAALAARAHGEDWYGWRSPRTGAGLADALRWLEPYALGTRTHVEFARSTIQFDRDRAAAGQKDYAPHRWDRGNAVATYALAGICEPRLKPLAADLAVATRRDPPDWLAFIR